MGSILVVALEARRRERCMIGKGLRLGVGHGDIFQAVGVIISYEDV